MLGDLIEIRRVAGLTESLAGAWGAKGFAHAGISLSALIAPKSPVDFPAGPLTLLTNERPELRCD